MDIFFWFQIIIIESKKRVDSILSHNSKAHPTGYKISTLNPESRIRPTFGDSDTDNCLE